MDSRKIYQPHFNLNDEGDLVVKINEKNYNLTKILQDKPDYEHLN